MGYEGQEASGGTSLEAIIDATLSASEPRPGLRWLDIGCGTGDLLRRVRDRWQPESLTGVDPIAWLAEDLRDDVLFHQTPAEELELPLADRVMMVETIEHLEAPWSALRKAARLVAPGGAIVVSTPNLSTLRHRLDLSLRGRLTSFRADNEPHLSPALPHVTSRVLAGEGLTVDAPLYAAADVIPLTKGRVWGERLRRRYPQLLSVSVIVCASRPQASEG
ncbi:MAG: methyltransferase domain-containing protein [Solirubrobacteraceae bacterium]|jgi:SAM-dependent methyltransferase